MAMKSGFFNSVNGDRKYKADFFSEYFANFIGNGIFPNPSSNFQVIANNNMTVTLAPGKAWINGVYCVDNLNFIIPIQVADGVLNRIDRVVLRLDTVTRDIQVVVKKGTFASSPVAPVLQRDADAYELGIANIYVSKGAISITQANITDLRLNKELCGIVHGTVDQVDTTTLFNQYLSWFQQKQAEFNTDLIDYKTTKQVEIDLTQQQFQDDFNAWFLSIKDILDTNVAANLLSMINTLNSQMSEKVNKVTGKDLSTNDYTTAEKNKLAGLSNVTLNNTVTSTSTTQAATANAVRLAYNEAAKKLDKSGGAITGELAVTGLIFSKSKEVAIKDEIKQTLRDEEGNVIYDITKIATSSGYYDTYSEWQANRNTYFEAKSLQIDVSKINFLKIMVETRYISGPNMLKLEIRDSITGTVSEEVMNIISNGSFAWSELHVNVGALNLKGMRILKVFASGHSSTGAGAAVGRWGIGNVGVYQDKLIELRY